MPPQEHARRLLVVLMLAAIALSAVIIRPFWVAFFFAAVLAAAFKPLMEWLTRKFGGRRNLAAALITLLVLLAVIVPVAGVGAVVVNSVLDGIQWLRKAIESEGVWGLIQRLPGPVEDAARRVLESVPRPQQQLQELAGQQGGQAAAAVGTVITATGSVVFQTVMMLIAFFFFLTDGHRLVRWIDERVPLRPGQFRTLLEDFRSTSVSVLTATLATAGIQSGTALVGYLIARAPNPVFLLFITFIVALIPSVGGAVVVVGVGLLLLGTGHPVAGGFLIGWGLVVVSLIDNVARPYLLKGGMELHGGIVFFALLGGLAVFGTVGLVIGPLAVTFLVATVKLYRREYGIMPDVARPGPGTEAAPPPPAGAEIVRKA